MGAIIGALYAAGHSTEDIEKIAANTSWRDVVDLSCAPG